MVCQVHRSVFIDHPLGIPNTSSRCYRVDTNFGSALFALGRYSQHADPRILTLTRELFPDDHGSHFLAVFRKWVKLNTSALALATYTAPPYLGTHLLADGWVFVSNHHGKKRWIRTL